MRGVLQSNGMVASPLRSRTRSGRLLIAEVESRIPVQDDFVALVESVGFEHVQTVRA